MFNSFKKITFTPKVKQCTPGVCMEKANYPGDPGGYRKRRTGVRSRGRCRSLCNRDPHCCHWVHYGRKRGNIKAKLEFYVISLLYSVPTKKQRNGPNTCFMKKQKSVFVQRNPKQVNNGPIFAGSLKCPGSRG